MRPDQVNKVRQGALLAAVFRKSKELMLGAKIDYSTWTPNAVWIGSALAVKCATFLMISEWETQDKKMILANTSPSRFETGEDPDMLNRPSVRPSVRSMEKGDEKK